ncbi:glycosyltransferase family 4 protein [Alsobacter sp. SYSU BS001988]
MDPSTQPTARPLRALVVTPTGSHGQGGIDRLYFYLRQAVATRGMEGVEISYFAARGGAAGWRWLPSFPLRLMAFLWTLAALRPDIVHLNHSTHGSAYRKAVLAWLARLAGRRVVIHFHGMVTPEDQVASPPWYRALGRMARGADRIVVLGRHFAPFFSRTLGARPDRVVVIPNGIPDFAPGPPAERTGSGPPLILFAGEVGPRKGADLMIAALQRLDGLHGDWRCVMAGNGDLAPYRAQATAAGLDAKLSFTGWVDSEAVHRLMREAAIVALPSRVEGLPLTLLEGGCAGAALVASDVGAIPDIVIEGVTGAVVPLDPDAIAAALAELLQDPERLRQAQRASRRIFEEHYEIGRFADRLRQLYLEVAGRPAVTS